MSNRTSRASLFAALFAELSSTKSARIMAQVLTGEDNSTNAENKAPVKTPPRPRRRSRLSFEEPEFNVRDNSSSPNQHPGFSYPIEQGYEKLSEIVDAQTAVPTELSSEDGGVAIPKLDPDDRTPLLNPEDFPAMADNPDRFARTATWVMNLPGSSSPIPEDFPIGPDNEYSGSSVRSLKPLGPGFNPPRTRPEIAKKVGNQANMREPQSNQASTSVPAHAGCDNRSQPDLAPKFLPLDRSRNDPTDKIAANIINPRYHASQVTDLLLPVPDLADQMRFMNYSRTAGRNSFFSKTPSTTRAMRDPILMQAQKEPLAMRHPVVEIQRRGYHASVASSQSSE